MREETMSATAGNRSKRWIFPICVVLLVLAAVGIDPVLSALKAHYQKTSIQPLAPLAEFDVARLPSFKLATGDSPFEIPHSDDEVGGDDMLSLRVQERTATGLAGQAYLVVTYYSDPEDSVPHTPEVCYRLLGAKIKSVASKRLELDSNALPASIVVRTVVAEESGATAVIAFAFCANAQYFTQRNEVRLEMGMPGDKRWYFAKIEVVARADSGEDTAPVLDRCLRLMGEALPELAMHYFPSRDDVSKRQSLSIGDAE